jgi:hypothetical protein
MNEPSLKTSGTKPPPEEEIANILNRIKTLEQARDSEDDKKYKQRQLRFNKWLTILTGCLVLTSFVASYISKTASDAAKQSADAAASGVLVAQESLKLNKESVEKTLVEMEAQSKAAQTSAEAATLQALTNKKALESSIEISRTDQRAWIVGKGIKFDKDLKAGELNPFYLSIVNAGRTPAQHVRLKYTSHMQIQDKPDIVRTELMKEDLALGPGREFQFRLDTVPPRINQADVDALESKTRVLTLFVEISYEDIFKNSHRTGICAFYKPELKPDFTLCSSGNYVE